MNASRSGWTLFLLVTIVLAGCGHGHRARRGADQLGQAPPVVQAAAEAVGAGKWADVSKLEADMTLVLYDSDQRYLLPGRVEVWLDRDRLVAWGSTARGDWKVATGSTGNIDADGPGLNEQELQRVAPAMQVYLRRLWGVWALTGPTRTVGEATDAFVGGKRVKRLAVRGPSEDKAYYFDETSKQLTFVTTGSDTPSETGLISRYSYQSLAERGMTLPNPIQAFEIGQYVLKSSQPMWRVELTNVRFR